MSDTSEDESFAPFAGLDFFVLDDEFLIGSDIQQMLESAGARSVVYVSTIEEARAAIETGAHFDLAILDLLLGREGRSSLALAETLTRRKIPLVFITGMGSEGRHAEIFPEVPVLLKPYHEAEFIAAVRRALRRR
ncbi:MAG TPA: hypothetical protein VFL51_05705 [Pseudolabrys sp.]|nr:hypothetical protein [Pseudolabrys sp.]